MRTTGVTLKKKILVQKFCFNRVNDGVILSGWGSMNNNAKLQHTQLIIENQTLCYNKYDTTNFDYILQLEPVLPDLIQPNLICATPEVGTCYV